jgi:hypothetical protein
MNAVNDTNGSPFLNAQKSKKNSVSVLQFAMALAFMALPATILFPIMAKPTADTVSEDLQQSFTPTLHMRHSLRMISGRELRNHIHVGESALWRYTRRS